MKTIQCSITLYNLKIIYKITTVYIEEILKNAQHVMFEHHVNTTHRFY